MREALPAGLSSGDRFGGVGAARRAGLEVEGWRSKLRISSEGRAIKDVRGKRKYGWGS